MLSGFAHTAALPVLLMAKTYLLCPLLKLRDLRGHVNAIVFGDLAHLRSADLQVRSQLSQVG